MLRLRMSRRSSTLEYRDKAARTVGGAAVRSDHRSSRPLGIAAIAVAMILATSAQWASASASQPITAGFTNFRSGLAPLLNARTWILEGTKLANGACRYKNVNDESVVPPGGWEERTIALDPDGCRKLIEAGTPTDLSPGGGKGDAQASASVAADPSEAGRAGVQPLASGTKTAYIRIFWMDPANIKVNQDVTQVHWSYNGSTVSGAYANGYWSWFEPTHWAQYGSSLTAAYQSGNTSIKGTTTSDFFNSWFCRPLPIVYTHYYYVRMWGHKDGTATWSQSSDSIDECFPFHWDKLTAYGAFPGF